MKDMLGLPDSTIDSLPKVKQYIKTGNTKLTALASDPNGTAAYDTKSNAAARKIKREFVV